MANTVRETSPGASSRPPSGTMFNVEPPAVALAPIGAANRSNSRVPLAEPIEMVPVQRASPGASEPVSSKKTKGGYAKMDAPPEEKLAHRAKRRQLVIVALTVILVGLLLVLVAVLLIRSTKALPPPYSRDQHLVVILIDGMRWDYPNRGFTPQFESMTMQGVRAKYLRPVFPSKTFPNLISIVTGLYPASHGVVSNTFYDPNLNETFSYDGSDPRLFSSLEPIWITADKQGVKTAVYQYPGCNVSIQGHQPWKHVPYNNSASISARFQVVTDWLTNNDSLTNASIPRFTLLYIDMIDMLGHRFGPSADQIHSALALIDAELTALMRAARVRTPAINFIVLSDHGMDQLSSERLIFLDDYINPDSVMSTETGAFVSLWPQPGILVSTIVNTLQTAHPHLRVYSRDTIPPQFLYKNNPRIAPIIGVPDAGWSVRWRRSFDVTRMPQGDHGYDPTMVSMQGTFMAEGPAFQKGLPIDEIAAVDVYNVMCAVLGLQPAPNNGSREQISSILTLSSDTRSVGINQK